MQATVSRRSAFGPPVTFTIASNVFPAAANLTARAKGSGLSNTLVRAASNRPSADSFCRRFTSARGSRSPVRATRSDQASRTTSGERKGPEGSTKAGRRRTSSMNSATAWSSSAMWATVEIISSMHGAHSGHICIVVPPVDGGPHQSSR